MVDVTLALALLLISGYGIAKLGNLIQLPSVTGYILAGLLLGPSGFGIITESSIGDKLNHFTSIALMLIAFGIGEQLEIKKLKSIYKSIGIIGIGETSGAYLLVGSGSLIIILTLMSDQLLWPLSHYIVLAILLAAVSVATAPAATLHVMRELKASGPLTTSLLAVVAIDDGLAIMFFGISVSLAHHIMGSGDGTILTAVTGGLIEICLSLSLGIIAGFLIDLIVIKIRNRSEMLTIGLAILLICGEVAQIMHLSPLLAGMAAGFTIINRERRDVRIFRVLNAFEPPIYVLFFTLAGTNLHISALISAGWLAACYFTGRALGKVTGTYLGAKLTGSPKTVQKYLGIALIPQAGVAIGLVFLITNDPALNQFSDIITPVVLAGVVLSELAGPLCAKFAVIHAGESGIPITREDNINEVNQNKNVIKYTNWKYRKLPNLDDTSQTVICGLSRPSSVPYITRVTLLLSNYFNTASIALRILPVDSKQDTKQEYLNAYGLFSLSKDEAYEFGGNLEVETIHSDNENNGIIQSAQKNNAKYIVLGHPVNKRIAGYHTLMEETATKAGCPVAVIRFSGAFFIDKILIPITKTEDLNFVQNMIFSLVNVGEHKITILYLTPQDTQEQRVDEIKSRLDEWIQARNLSSTAEYIVKPTETMLETILDESEKADIILMSASESSGMQMYFFGSLGEDVANNCKKPMIVVYNPKLDDIYS